MKRILVITTLCILFAALTHRFADSSDFKVQTEYLGM